MMKAAESTVPNGHQPDAGQVGPLGQAVPAEDPEAEEGGLQEEGGQTLEGQRTAEHVARRARVGGPVHAELELLNEPGHHADGDVDQQQRPEEAGQAQVGLVAVAVPAGLQQGHQEGQADASPGRRGSGRCWCWRTASGRGPGLTVGRSLRWTSGSPASRRAGAAQAVGGPVVHPLLPPQAGVAAAGGRRSSWVPRSTTRPPSRTMISSTSLQPGQPVRDEQGGAALGEGEQVGGQRVGGGGIEVLAGSSSTRMGKSASRARATATRWRCPPDRRRPVGPTGGGEAVGQPGEPVAQADPGQDVLELVVGGACAGPTRRFSASVVSKRWGLCSTSPTTRRTSSAARRSSGTPSSVASPASAGRKRTRTSASVDLPAPLGPTSATRRPGRAPGPRRAARRVRLPG